MPVTSFLYFCPKVGSHSTKQFLWLPFLWRPFGDLACQHLYMKDIAKSLQTKRKYWRSTTFFSCITVSVLLWFFWNIIEFLNASKIELRKSHVKIPGLRIQSPPLCYKTTKIANMHAKKACVTPDPFSGPWPRPHLLCWRELSVPYRPPVNRPACRPAQKAIRGRGGSRSFHIVRYFIQIRHIKFKS